MVLLRSSWSRLEHQTRESSRTAWRDVLKFLAAINGMRRGGCFVAMNEQNAAIVLVGACVRGLVQQGRWYPCEGVLERSFVEYQKSITSGIVCSNGGNMARPRLTKHLPVIVDQDEITLSLKI